MRLDRSEIALLGGYGLGLVVQLLMLAKQLGTPLLVIAFGLSFFVVPWLLSLIGMWSIMRLKYVSWLLAPYAFVLGTSVATLSFALPWLADVADQSRPISVTGVLVGLVIYGQVALTAGVPLVASFMYARRTSWRFWGALIFGAGITAIYHFMK